MLFCRTGQDASRFQVKLRLPDGTTYDQTGTIDFVDVQVDQTTDSVTVRAEFPNPDFFLTAGQFDLLVELVCADRRQLLDLTNRIRGLDGVVSTETFLYLELWKQLYDWGAQLSDGNGGRG